MRSSSRWRVVWLQWIKRLLTVPSWPWRFGWIFQHRKIKTIKIFKIIFQTFWLLRVAQLTVQCIVSSVYNIWWQKMILLPQLCSHLEFEWQKLNMLYDYEKTWESRWIRLEILKVPRTIHLCEATRPIPCTVMRSDIWQTSDHLSSIITFILRLPSSIKNCMFC